LRAAGKECAHAHARMSERFEDRRTPSLAQPCSPASPPIATCTLREHSRSLLHTVPELRTHEMCREKAPDRKGTAKRHVETRTAFAELELDVWQAILVRLAAAPRKAQPSAAPPTAAALGDGSRRSSRARQAAGRARAGGRRLLHEARCDDHPCPHGLLHSRHLKN